MFIGAVALISTPCIIPMPQEMHMSGGEPFVISRETVVVGAPNDKPQQALNRLLITSAGFELQEKQGASRNAIVFSQAHTWDKLAPEGYKLDVKRDRIDVTYADSAGAFYAMQTLRQLLPPDIESSSRSIFAEWKIPAVSITDSPRFSWRGMHLDVSRHFFPPSYIKRYIDFLAMHKMNVFHWHLVDDGGWRMQIDKYPKLTDIGAWRIDTGEVWPGGAWNMGNLAFPGKSSGKKLYGGFYTKQDIRDIVQYASERHVTIVPEIEMPGHALPALISYPEMGCQNIEKSGLPRTNVFCAGSDATMQFLKDILDETMELFPSQFIHIGADEVWKGFWQNCPRCQARMKAEGLANPEELQSWFVKQMERYISSKRRRLIGWDEILEGGLAPGAAVMSWRGVDGGIAAAKAGHDVVMSPTSHCYFDYPYTTTSTQLVYSYNPIPAELSADESKHVLGAQANVWTEYIPSTARIETMIFPRMLATAESVWTLPARKDWSDFSQRLANYYSRLDAMNAAYFIEAPILPSSAILFDSSTLVEATAVTGMPFKLRYTTDGTLPTQSSPEYKRPVQISESCYVTFAYVTSSGKVGEVARVDCRKYSPEPVTDEVTQGLDVMIYEGTWSKMPEFTKLVARQATSASEVNDALAPREENFALRFLGWFSAPKDGEYSFKLGSDDGSLMLLGGAKLIDNDGLHAYAEKSASIRLKKGMYPLMIGFFQSGGAKRLTFSMSGGGLYRKK